MPIPDSRSATEKPARRYWYVRIIFGIVRLLSGILAVVAIVLSAIFLFFGFFDVRTGTKSYDFPIGIGLVVIAYFLWMVTGVSLSPRRNRGGAISE